MRPTAPVSRIFLGTLLLVAGCGGDPVVPEPNTITISPASVTLQSLGETVQLTASVEDRDGRIISGVTVTWAAGDESVATVDTSGLITATGNGVATVEASVEGVAGSSEVTVAQRVANVLVSPKEWPLRALGATIPLEARAADANGHAIEDPEFTWSSRDESVVAVDAGGLVTAVGNGEAIVEASAEGVSGFSQVRVQQWAKHVQVSPEKAILVEVGDTIRLLAEATDANGYVIEGAKFTWTSDRPAVTVDGAGLVTAAGNGVVPVYAKAGRARGGALVTVELDRGVLLKLYETMGGVDWSRSEKWGTDSLTGPIPAGIGNNPSLSVIVVSNNQLTGPIPSEFGDLQRLKHLDISNNQFIGPVPPEIGNLGQLSILRVNDTLLSGQLPLELIGLPLKVFTWDGTDLCASDDEEFQEWLKSILSTSGPDC